MIPARDGPIREKRHRLPRDWYRGHVTVAVTACVAGGQPLFHDADVVAAFVDRLGVAAAKNGCGVLIYYFMPEHQHLIVHGNAARADAWRAVVDYKQQTGFWLGRHRPDFRWQKDFYDHIIRDDEDLGAQIRYVAENPVRRGLVTNWRDYPYTGAIGVSLSTVLADAATL